MRPVKSGNSIGLDRMATQHEVHCALSFSSGDTLELSSSDDSGGSNPVFSCPASDLVDEMMWLALACKISNSICN